MIQDCIIQILLEAGTPSAMGLPVVFQTFLDYCQGWKAVYFVVLKLSQLILLLSCIPSPLTIKKVLSYPKLESPFCKNSIHMKLVFFFFPPSILLYRSRSSPERCHYSFWRRAHMPFSTSLVLLSFLRQPFHAIHHFLQNQSPTTPSP